jgi:hypothetical protein
MVRLMRMAQFFIAAPGKNNGVVISCSSGFPLEHHNYLDMELHMELQRYLIVLGVDYL